MYYLEIDAKNNMILNAVTEKWYFSLNSVDKTDLDKLDASSASLSRSELIYIISLYEFKIIKKYFDLHNCKHYTNNSKNFFINEIIQRKLMFLSCSIEPNGIICTSQLITLDIEIYKLHLIYNHLKWGEEKILLKKDEK